MTNLMSNDQHFMPSTMASHTSMPSPRSQDSMGQAIDLPLNYDAPRFYMNFQSPSVSAAMLRQGQVTPPMQDLGDPTEDDFGLDCSLYSPAVSTSRGQLTPPMSISDLDGYTEQDFMTLDCNLPVGMTSSNGKFYLQEKRRMQNREAQRRFRARNQKHIKGLQKELNDLRSENRKLLEEHEQKVEEISRLQEKINDMNREMKETKESKETETKLDCDAPARCQCWTRNGTLARFRPTEILCTTRRTSGPGSPENTAKEEDCRSGYSVLMELVPADHRNSDKSYESFRKRLESQAGEESEDTSETTERTTNSEPEGKYFLLSPLSVH